MQTKIITGAAEIRKHITSIGNRGAKLDKDIQLAALSVLAHIDQHGDVTLADALVNAMPKSSRKLALVEAMLACGKVRLLDKAELTPELKALGRVFAYDKERKTDLQQLEEKPWYEWRKEAPVAMAFDAQKATAALLAKIKLHSGLTVAGIDEAKANLREALAALEAMGEAAPAAQPE